MDTTLFLINSTLYDHIDVLALKSSSFTKETDWIDWQRTPGEAITKALFSIRNAKGHEGLSKFKNILRDIGYTEVIKKIEESPCAHLFVHQK